MRIRGEEDRALRGLLPDDVKADAVRLNVASRERGGESVITPSHARELGADGVRAIVRESADDPARATRLIEKQMTERAMRHRGGRER